MAQINLLPWRDERRAELKRDFLVTLALCAVLGCSIPVTAQQPTAEQYQQLQQQVAAQNARLQELEMQRFPTVENGAYQVATNASLASRVAELESLIAGGGAGGVAGGGGGPL